MKTLADLAGDPFAQDGDLDFDDGYCFVGRLTYTPLFDCDCACRVHHLGFGFEYCDLYEGRSIEFSARPYHDTNVRFADTGSFVAEDYFTFNIELAFVYGPWSLQAEYYNVNVSSNASNDPSFSGWYVQGSYWLTGSASWRPRRRCWRRARPRRCWRASP